MLVPSARNECPVGSFRVVDNSVRHLEGNGTARRSRDITRPIDLVNGHCEHWGHHLQALRRADRNQAFPTLFLGRSVHGSIVTLKTPLVFGDRATLDSDRPCPVGSSHPYTVPFRRVTLLLSSLWSAANPLRSQAGKTLKDLFEEHLRAIYEYSDDWARTQTSFANHPLLNSTKNEVRLSVPQMWDPSACKVLMEAVQEAGLPKTELISELIAAIAWTFDRIVANHLRILPINAAGFKEGDIVLVIQAALLSFAVFLRTNLLTFT
jgi:hypothetical protein